MKKAAEPGCARMLLCVPQAGSGGRSSGAPGEQKSFFRHAEAITEMYSLPSYWGFDPTSIYALFYIVFFGMMFSDAGYGLFDGDRMLRDPQKNSISKARPGR